MRGISDTIARLAAAAAHTSATPEQGPTDLRLHRDFGSNPGALRAHVHIPAGLPDKSPLVVVLHGCTQSAASYDRASGWSQLADEEGFALLYPEQQRSNNPNNCFNWFEVGDSRRDAGEVLSIRQMIASVELQYRTDTDRIFITGLSAGGAMTATLLATYPEVFAGGAIIAGLPYGVASGILQAFDRMRGYGLPADDDLVNRVRSASNHAGPWPRISVWHGTADTTVAVENAGAIIDQWRGLHDLAGPPSSDEQIDGARYRAWLDPQGRVCVEAFIIPGMGHGTPLKTHGPGAYGTVAPFMLDVGISSTARIAQFWGLSRHQAKHEPRSHEGGATGASSPARVELSRLHGRRSAAVQAHAGVGNVIEDALRAAGLMK